ncbi:hypothetical protein NYZ99_04755 [Maribacter litopenaei]|uniref:Phage integrase SAM-like domain-containing protein n=1 Tax=Maribacter litopenaei TaxID=2976127 RepID=A0ABY5YBY7_9FLAO|nr:hypothetical protein [Maribacter litopenaei]UWX55739.1 hypothetical protein NYZ99_04755 [Maribacter litopenaei]
MEVNLAYYRKKDWKKFLSMIDDRESMFDTWKEWHKSYLMAKKQLSNKGLKVYDVEVDLVKLDHYCRENGLKNIGKTRSQFVSNKT